MRAKGPGLVVVATALLSGCSSCRSAPAPKPLVYVSDEEGGLVVAVDPATATVVTKIPVGKRPRGIKVSRDGKKLFVALSGSPRGGPGIDESKLPPGDRSADGIGVVDLATLKLAGTLPSGQDPETFDLSPDGDTMYISNEETAELSVVDVTSGFVKGRVKVGEEPEGVTVSPDGKRVFVTSEGDSEVTAVDTATRAVVGHMPTGKRPRTVVFTKDGLTAFAPGEAGGNVTVLDAVAYKSIGEIPIHTDSPMPSGPRPMGAILSPDGKQLWVTCGRGGSVAIIDVASRKQVRSLDGVGDRPWGIALSRDGMRFYTANGTSHDVSVVDPVSGNVEKRVVVGGLPWGVAVAP
jgi:YVTN family beta-propeller protein